MWDERLPAIRAYLERCKDRAPCRCRTWEVEPSCGAARVRTSQKVLSNVLLENPAVKALLDEYDVIQGDERYSPYKYDAP